MTFEEVLPAAKKSCPIRRKAWGKAYIKFYPFYDNMKYGEFRTAFGNPITLNRALFETDWEFVTDEFEND